LCQPQAPRPAIPVRPSRDQRGLASIVPRATRAASQPSGCRDHREVSHRLIVTPCSAPRIGAMPVSRPPRSRIDCAVPPRARLDRRRACRDHREVSRLASIVPRHSPKSTSDPDPVETTARSRIDCASAPCAARFGVVWSRPPRGLASIVPAGLPACRHRADVVDVGTPVVETPASTAPIVNWSRPPRGLALIVTARVTHHLP